MRYRTLGSTGLEVSILSFGASSLGGVFHPVAERQCVETVEAALAGGINFIDVSPAYGETLAEKNLGRALRGVPRNRYILATKIGSYSEARGDYDYSTTRTRQSVEESLGRLGVDHLDLIQCHDVEFADHDQIINETLPALAELKRQGVVRHIGITGLPLKVFPALLERDATRTIETILSFCHYELNDTSLEGLLPGLKARGVGVINASPTGMGLLTQRGAPGWHPASPAIIAGCKRAVNFCRERGIDIVKPAVQFACSHLDIVTTLVGTADPDNIRKNIAYVEEPMDEQLVKEIQQVLSPVMNANFTRGRPEHRDPLLPPSAAA